MVEIPAFQGEEGVNSLVGSWAVFAVVLSGALASVLSWRTAWPPLIPLVPLVGSGWELQISHASPRGPITVILLVLRVVWILPAHRLRA